MQIKVKLRGVSKPPVWRRLQVRADGGPWGYAELKEILADPAHERHQEMLDWLELADASAFDPKAVVGLAPNAGR